MSTFSSARGRQFWRANELAPAALVPAACMLHAAAVPVTARPAMQRHREVRCPAPGYDAIHQADEADMAKTGWMRKPAVPDFLGSRHDKNDLEG